MIIGMHASHRPLWPQVNLSNLIARQAMSRRIILASAPVPTASTCWLEQDTTSCASWCRACAGVSKLQAQLEELRKPPHCRLPPAAASKPEATKGRQAPAPAQLALGSLVDFEEHEADELPSLIAAEVRVLVKAARNGAHKSGSIDDGLTARDSASMMPWCAAWLHVSQLDNDSQSTVESPASQLKCGLLAGDPCGSYSCSGREQRRF